MQWGVDPLQVALARLVVDDQPTEELPGLATEALVRGLDSPALRELAGTPRAEVRDARDRFLCATAELGFPTPTEEQARRLLVRHWAEQMTTGALSPYAASRSIWKKAAWELPEDAGLMVFVGLASEWEDHPEDRREIEAQMLQEAARIVGRMGA